MVDSPAEGLVIVDKPSGMTSHDVVGRVRRIAGTRRVGHAGTLDPMATGVLVLGIGRATRLLGRLTLTDKAYDATIRLGVSTATDDAEGDVVARTDAGGVSDEAIRAGVARLTGTIDQVPSQVSAIKVGGRRAYELARAGEQVRLEPRRVTVVRFDVLSVGRAADGSTVDLDVRVECTSGTYVRALARDLGRALGVGGHLTALRRTRVGPFTEARTLEALAERLDPVPLGAAAAALFPRRDLDAGAARTVVHGGWLPASGEPGPVAAYGPDGAFLALVEDTGGRAKPVAVFG